MKHTINVSYPSCLTLLSMATVYKYSASRLTDDRHIVYCVVVLGGIPVFLAR